MTILLQSFNFKKWLYILLQSSKFFAYHFATFFCFAAVNASKQNWNCINFFSRYNIKKRYFIYIYPKPQSSQSVPLTRVVEPTGSWQRTQRNWGIFDDEWLIVVTTDRTQFNLSMTTLHLTEHCLHCTATCWLLGLSQHTQMLAFCAQGWGAAKSVNCIKKKPLVQALARTGHKNPSTGVMINFLHRV